MWFSRWTRQALFLMIAVSPSVLPAQRRASRPGHEQAPKANSTGAPATLKASASPVESGTAEAAPSQLWRLSGTDAAPAAGSSRKRHARTGAIIGAGIGAAIGLIGGVAGEGLNADGADEGKIVLATLVSAAIFGLIGAGIGALFP